MLAVPYQTVVAMDNKTPQHEASPLLAFRKNAGHNFDVYKGDLSCTPMASLGLHVPAAHVTVFRFVQRSTRDHRRCLALAKNVLTLLKPCSGVPLARSITMPRKRSASAAAKANEDDEEKQVEKSCCLHTPSPTAWPLNGYTIRHLLGGVGGVKASESQRANGDLLEFLGLERDPKPVFNLLALVCARLLPVLPVSAVTVYQDLRHRWRQANPTAAWGPCMKVAPWSSGAGPDPAKDCFEQYEVSLPTRGKDMCNVGSIEERLRLLAAALGVPALVVNADLTLDQCGDFHRIVEAIAPWLGVVSSVKWRGVEVVTSMRGGGGITRTYLDLSHRAEQMYTRLIDMFVGRQAYLEYVFGKRRAGLLDDNATLLKAASRIHVSIVQVINDLTSVVPRGLLRKVFEGATLMKTLGELAGAATNSVLVTGVTGSGKSTLLSALIALSSGSAPPPAEQQQQQQQQQKQKQKQTRRRSQRDGDGTDANVGGEEKAAAAALGISGVFESEYTTFLEAQGIATEKAATQALPAIVDALFNPENGGSSTVSLPLLKLLTAGNPTSSSTHISTRIVNGPGPAGDTVTLYVHGMDRLVEMLGRCATLQQFLGDCTQIAGKEVVVRLPRATTRIQRNGQLRALFNTLHGVPDDPRPPLLLQFPELVRLVEFSSPLAFGANAYQDQIGELERNRLLENAEDGEHMVRCVVIGHFNASAHMALANALNATDPHSKRRVMVLYNVTNNPNSEVEIRKASTVLANEARTSVHRARHEIEEAFPAFINNMSFVAFDPVSAAGMMEIIRRPYVLGVEHLWRLPLALKHTGLAEFMFAQYECVASAGLEVVGPARRLEQVLESLETSLPWDEPAVISVEMRTALQSLDSGAIAETALRLAVKHDDRRTKAASGLQEAIVAAYNTLSSAAANDRDKDCFDVDEDLILDILRQTETAVVGELGPTLDAYAALGATRSDRGASFVYLRKLTAFLEQQRQVALASEEEILARAKGAQLWDDMAVKLVYDTHTDASPFASFALRLKTMALDAASLYMVGACYELKRANIVVDLRFARPLPLGEGSLETQVRARLAIDGIQVDGRRLEGKELAEHARVLLNVADIVAFRVVEQQCISTLKIEAALEPTADMVGRTMLHHLRGRRDRLAQVIKEGGSEAAAAAKIVRLMRECLDRSFKGFTVPATLLHLTGPHHPGALVSSGALVQNHEGRDSLMTWLKDQVKGVLGKVNPFLEQVTSARAMVELHAQYASAILGNRRVGLVAPEVPRQPGFPRYNVDGEDDDVSDFNKFFKALGGGIDCEVPAHPHEGLVDDDGGRTQIEAWASNTMHVKVVGGWNAPFTSLREVMGHILDICSSEVTVEMMHEDFDQQRVKDVGAITEYFRACKEGGDRLQRFYEAYKARNQLSVEKLVKTLMHAVAAITPGELARAFWSGDRPVWRRYIPSSTVDLTAAACLDDGGELKSRRELGVPDYVFEHLSSLEDASPTTLRRALEELEVRGDDLCHCLVFELLVTAIVKQRAIAVVIMDKASGMQHHVFRPELRVPRWGNGGGADEVCCLGKVGASPVDVIAVLNNQYYLLSGQAMYDDANATFPTNVSIDNDYDVEQLTKILEDDGDLNFLFDGWSDGDLENF
jgi:energy-coupling factor transporter ATP-binding protein EcfA2